MQNSWSFTQQPVLYGALAAAAVFAAAGVFFLAPVSATAERGPSSEKWAESFAIFAKEVGPTDALPDYLVKGDQSLPELDYVTARGLGTDSIGVRYWAALDTSNKLCLVVALPGEFQLTGLGCATLEDFSKRALAVQVADKSTATSVYLLPDAYISAAENASLGTFGSNLVIAHPYDTTARSAVAPDSLTDSGTDESITLQPFGEIDRTFGAGQK